jgi:predicted transcriptional regulator
MRLSTIVDKTTIEKYLKTESHYRPLAGHKNNIEALKQILNKIIEVADDTITAIMVKEIVQKLYSKPKSKTSKQMLVKFRGSLSKTKENEIIIKVEREGSNESYQKLLMLSDEKPLVDLQLLTERSSNNGQ